MEMAQYCLLYVNDHYFEYKSRSLAPGQNAATLPVAAGIVAAVLWMLEKPREGIKTPEELSHDFVLDIARLYLGKFISKPE